MRREDSLPRTRAAGSLETMLPIVLKWPAPHPCGGLEKGPIGPREERLGAVPGGSAVAIRADG